MCQCDFYSFTLWNSRNWNLYVVRDITDMLCFKTIPWRHNKYCKFGSCKSCVDNFVSCSYLLFSVKQRLLRKNTISHVAHSRKHALNHIINCKVYIVFFVTITQCFTNRGINVATSVAFYYMPK